MHAKKPKSISVIIWDILEYPPIKGLYSTHTTFVLWRRYSSGNSLNELSIPDYIELNSDYLKNNYLDWIHELGHTYVQGKKFIEWLEIRPGFSFWWMTAFSEKCNFSKSININEIIRLKAFNHWAEKQNISSMTLYSDRRLLVKSFEVWSRNNRVKFKFKKNKDHKKNSGKKLNLNLLTIIQAILWLIHYLFDRYKLKKTGLEKWKSFNADVTFFSYLFNLSQSSLKSNFFESPYWTDLPNLIKDEKKKSNWFHFFIKDSAIPNSSMASEVLEKFNTSKSNHQCHVTIDSFLTLKVIISSIRDWLSILIISFKLKKAIIYSQEKLCFDFWSLCKSDWQKSFYGKEAIQNLLHLNQIEYALKILPKQNVGFYLQENQGWEFALINSWKKNGHGTLIGVPHTTVRYWDLRYFWSPRGYDGNGILNLPLPNLIAVNSDAMKKSFESSGCPHKMIVRVEALRYSYLHSFRKKKYRQEKSNKKTYKLLVLGDYLPSNTKWQMDLLTQSLSLLSSILIEVFFKPHPNCKIDPDDYPFKLIMTSEPLNNLFAMCDFVYCSAVTSSSIDAYSSGLPLAVSADPAQVNLSPLRGYSDVVFATSPEHLAKFIENITSSCNIVFKNKKYFFLDPKMRRWRNLLSNTQNL